MAKILLVEDDNNLREIYEARLQAEGYDIIAAKDGEEALAVAVKEKPDLIISDVMMPKISGFDMLDILRSTPETKNAKVIMMTALSQAEDQARAEKLGADRYLVKSQVTLEDVAKVAKEVLEGGDSPAPALDTQAPAAAPEAPVAPVPTTETPATPAPAPEPVVPSATEPSNPEVAASEPASTVPPTTDDSNSTSTPVADDQTAPAPEPPTQPAAADEPASEPTASSENSEAITIPGLPPLEENSPTEESRPAPQPLHLDAQSSMPSKPEADSSTPAGQTGAPFLVSEPSAAPAAATPATPPPEMDESAQIAANIESFLSAKETATNTVSPTPAPQPEPLAQTPVAAPVISPAPAPEPQASPEPQTAPVAQPVEAPTATTPAPAPAPQPEPAAPPATKSGYKVIQPINDINKPPVDLEAMAKKEEELGAAQQIINNPVSTPGDQPKEEAPIPPKPAGATIDPTTLAL